MVSQVRHRNSAQQYMPRAVQLQVLCHGQLSLHHVSAVLFPRVFVAELFAIGERSKH